MKKNVLFIVNPVSGTTGKGNITHDIESLIDKGHSIMPSSRPNMPVMRPNWPAARRPKASIL